MSSKKVTPKGPFDSKGVLTRLFTCGSGKKQFLLDQKNSPIKAPGDEEEEEFESVSREVKTVQSMKVQNQTNDGEEEIEISYTDIKTIGKGTFGVVYKARLCNDSKIVAIKKVFDDKRYKNRELLFMKQLHHPNIANLIYYFYTEDAGCRKGERYLNMILEFVPKTLFGLAKCDGTYTKPLLDPLYIKVYTYQMFRCLNYLHSQNICHRDIKPQNLLIDPSTHVLKLCDFGSAKELLKNESNVAYICSRYYRAPELIFGAKDYSCLIDIWSGGCVLGELFQGHPLFPGATGPDQLVEIMKVLGTPTYEDIMDINHGITNMRLPPVLVPLPWHKIFTKQQLSYDATDLISKLLVFSPKKRLDALSACAHPFFNELRTYGVRLPDGSPLPPLFNFTKEEIAHCPQIRERLIPPGWTEEWNNASVFSHSPGIGQASNDDSLKNKLVMLARNSFKKTSFKMEKNQVPTQDFEVEEDDARPTLDVMELAREAHQRMNLSSHSHAKEDTEEDEKMDTKLDHGMMGLSIQTDQESDPIKKKKKKSSHKRNKSVEEEAELTALSTHGSRTEQTIIVTEDELDGHVPIPSGSGESSSVNQKTRKKKKKMQAKGVDGEEDLPRVHHSWDENLNEDELRAISSSTPADFDERSTEVKVVKKVKAKRQKSVENSVHRSFENLEEGLAHSSSSPRNKGTRGRTRAINRVAKEGVLDGAREDRALTSVVTKVTVEGGAQKKVKKKRAVKHYDHEDEV